MGVPHFSSVPELAAALDRIGYLPDDGLATAVFLAIRLHRPLFLEGDPGVGKTALARALSEVLGAPLIRLQCHGGLDVSQALYEWNFPRQVLQLRSAGERITDPGLVASLYAREFLTPRPILAAIENAPSVLLIDEIDRADDEFEALLLEVLEDGAVTIPEIGPIRGAEPPTVILTSNRTREVHDALKRRCLYHWIAHPEVPREIEILRRHLDGLSEQLAREVATALARLRELDLIRAPGIAEAIDLARAALELGGQSLTPELTDAALGTIVKHHDDWPRARQALRGERRIAESRKDGRP